MDLSAIDRSTTAIHAPAPAVPVDKAAEKREVVQAIKAVNGTEMFGPENELRFQKDPETNRFVVRVVNRNTPGSHLAGAGGVRASVGGRYEERSEEIRLAHAPRGFPIKKFAGPSDKGVGEHMWTDGHDAYLESRVLTADPIELVNLLYQACTEAVRGARRYLAEGRIAERSREINRAYEIVIRALHVVGPRARWGDQSAPGAALRLHPTAVAGSQYAAERRTARRGSGPVIHTLRGMGGNSKGARRARSGKPLVATGCPGNAPRSRGVESVGVKPATARGLRRGHCRRGRFCSLRIRPSKIASTCLR